MGRAPCCEKDSVKRGPWTPEEDAKLLACVAQHGTGSWRMLPKKAGLQRCGKSCRLRWTNYLRPDLKHGRFSESEEQTIVRLHAALGSRWSLIAAQLPGRTDNDVKNYWNTRLKKKLCEMGIDPITHKPISQLLADLAGSMQQGTMPSTTPTTSNLTSSSGPTNTAITEAALGCFKDDMLNVIMRRNPRMASLPSQPPQVGYYNSTNIQSPYYSLNPSTSHVTSFFPHSQSHYNVSSSAALMPSHHGQQNPPHSMMDLLQQPPSDMGALGTGYHKGSSITNTNVVNNSNYSKVNTTSRVFFTSSTSSTMMHHQKSDKDIHSIVDSTPVSSLSTLSHEPADNQGKLNYLDPFSTNEEEDTYVVNQRGFTSDSSMFSWPTTNSNPLTIGEHNGDHDQLFLHPTSATSPATLQQLHMLNPTNSTYKGGNNLHIQSMSPSCTSRSSSTCSNLPNHDVMSPYSTPPTSLPQNNDAKQQRRASPPRINSHTSSDNPATHLSSMDTMIWDLSDLNTLMP